MYTFAADRPAHHALGADRTQVDFAALIDILLIWHQMLHMSGKLVLAFMLICYVCKHTK